MKKLAIFLVCLLAALAIDFLREGLFSRVYAQFVIITEPQSTTAKGGYQAPDPSIKPKKAPYPISGKPDPAQGTYPPPRSQPADK